MNRLTYKTGSSKPEPPKSELGPAKKKFSETFSAVIALREHFNKATDPCNTDQKQQG